MAWRERYQQASFRGVPFYVENADTSVGRRTHDHEYPTREEPFIEDLGRKVREFNITGYLVGPDYDLARANIEAACEAFGPGELVHPYRGTITVNCKNLGIRESKDEGGMCRLTFTFIESGQRLSPTGVIDQGSIIGLRVKDVVGLSISQFVQDLVTVGVPEFVREAAEGQISSLLGVLDSVAVAGAATIEQLSSFKNTIVDLVENVDQALLNPGDLGGTLAGLISEVGNIAAAPLKDLVGISQQVPMPGNSNTSNQKIAQNNRSAVVKFQSQVAIAESARVLQRTTFSSFDDAVSARNIITAQIDAVADTASDAIYTALQGLRANIIEAVPSPDESLPRITVFPTADTLPSLVVSNELYANIKRAGEVVSRNKVRHPGFISGGRDLEVLTDG